MNNEIYLKAKGIVKKDGKYLVIKRWVDDLIPDPYIWEFVDGEISHGESPDDGVCRLIQETLGVEGKIEKIIYTWSLMLGDIQCVGIAYLCTIEADDSSFVLPEDYCEWKWIDRDDFSSYIENRFVLRDLEGVEL